MGHWKRHDKKRGRNNEIVNGLEIERWWIMKWETGGEDNEPRMEDNKLRVGGKRMLATRKLVHNFSEH